MLLPLQSTFMLVIIFTPKSQCLMEMSEISFPEKSKGVKVRAVY